MFNHDAYTDTTTNLIAKGNTFENASAFGLTVSASGSSSHETVNPVVEYNLFVGDGNGMTFGAGGKYAIQWCCHPQQRLYGNRRAIGIDIGES